NAIAKVASHKRQPLASLARRPIAAKLSSIRPPRCPYLSALQRSKRDPVLDPAAWLLYPAASLRARSSAGQSAPLIRVRSEVRILAGPFNTNYAESVIYASPVMCGAAAA